MLESMVNCWGAIVSDRCKLPQSCLVLDSEIELTRLERTLNTLKHYGICMICLVSLEHEVAWVPCYHGDNVEALRALLDCFGMMLAFACLGPAWTIQRVLVLLWKLSAESGVGGRGNSASSPTGLS